MNGKNHLVLTTLFFIALYATCNELLKTAEFTITLIIAAIPISFFPDIDQNFNFMSHRNFLTHSIILWEIVYYFNQQFIFLLFIVAIGFHCLCDIRLLKNKWRGFYTIKFFSNYTKTKGLNGRNSTIYLMLNFLIAITQFIIMCSWS